MAAGEQRERAPRRAAWVAGAGAVLLLGAFALVISALGTTERPSPRRVASQAGAAQALKPGSLRIMVLGDSLAGSLAPGLADALGKQAEVFNGGSPGCSLASYQLASNFRFTVPPGKPCVEGQPEELLRTWRRWIQGWHPNLVLYLARNDLADQQMHGAWTHVGEPAFDRYYQGRLSSALQLFADQGLPAVLMVPNQAESGNRLNVAVPEEEPARRVALAAQLREAVARAGRRPQAFSVLDLASVLSTERIAPLGLSQPQLFCPDGAHLVPSTGGVVAGVEQRRWAKLAKPVAPPVEVGVPVPPLRPRWWIDLQCAS